MIAQRLMEAGIDLTDVVKDGDSNSTDAMKKHFPDLKVMADKNHVVKNLPEHVKTAAKNGCQQLRGRSVQVQNHIRRILEHVHRLEALRKAGDARFDLQHRKRIFE